VGAGVAGDLLEAGELLSGDQRDLDPAVVLSVGLHVRRVIAEYLTK
jgi:hypothetical protein